MVDPRNLKPGWKAWRFDQIAVNANERVDDPSTAGVEHYVGLEHLDADSLKIRRWGTPGEVEATKLRFRKGDIIFGRRRVYQRKLGVAEFDGICSAHAMVLRAKPDVVLPGFLPLFMQSDLFMRRAVEISVGSLSPTINWRTLAEQTFALPPRDYQLRVVRLLSAMDEVVNESVLLLAAAVRSTTSLREELMVTRGEASTLGAALEDIHAGKSLVATNEAPAGTSTKAVLKVSAVGDGVFRAEEAKTLLDQSAFISEHTVKRGYVLISRANTPDLVGLVCLVDRDYPNLMLSDKTLRLVPKAGMSPRLLMEAIRTASARQYLKANATGTGGAMKNISQEKLRDMPIRLPKKEQRRATAIVLDDSANAIEIVQQRLFAARELRRTLLSHSQSTS